MDIILYTGGIKGDASEGLLGHITAKFTHARLESIDTLPDLQRRLTRLPKTIDAAVLVAMNDAQLSEMVGMQDFLDGIPLILIIPDFEKETVAKAAKLYPSFICTLDSEWEVVATILERIMLYREKAASALRVHPGLARANVKQESNPR